MKSFSKTRLYNLAMEACKKGGCTCVEDMIAYLPCSKPTFYSYIKADSKEMGDIREAMERSKRKVLVSIRSKLYKSESPTAWITLYKMLCTPEERDAISMSRTDVTTNGKDIVNDPIVIEVIDRRSQVEGEDE